ncbi:sporulation integral membrane protein YlbJ [Fictibacillus aquaticus]|uniref:Sporulation integral membrane protein YlbJ n=1 Tax=Fictibacillus aquaticus TaxID=2021314 RepID=A0A235FDY7_9BACL|nr:sporulation integral membrane protein YlbJ [Fictibacillus aquaticus]OYD58965.1 sporulation integral membrane protein YlbJ [Fictibacillus aquaticus]
MQGGKLKTLGLGISGTLLAGSVMMFPEESFKASLDGLNLWWDVVFPSLLPFFILSELLIGFGVVHFIGVLLEPLMRPLFKVPGAGGFVWAMGLSSGFPAGAKLTARLWQQKELSSTEAERLVSFTNCSNPLFMFGAIAVGFFHNPAVGIVLAVCHYGGNILVGFTMRFYKGNEPSSPKYEKDRRAALKNALSKMHVSRIKDGRPIGKLLGDSVQSSVNTLMMIGGFLILFSVLSKMLDLLYITKGISILLNQMFSFFKLPTEISYPLMTGIFEITLGSKLSSTADVPLLIQCTAVSFILAFSGLSVQAQVASILADTDIRFKPFFAARILHALYASTLCVFLFPLLYNSSEKSAQEAMAWFGTGGLQLSGIWQSFLAASPYVTLFSLVAYIFIMHSRWMDKTSRRY